MAKPSVPRLGYKETSQQGQVQVTVRDPAKMPWPKPSGSSNPYAPTAFDLTEGLVAHYKLNEGTGTTTADVIFGNNGTLTNGATWTDGRVAGGVLFDGTDDFIDITYSPALSFGAAITLAAWIKPSDLSGARRIITLPSHEGSGSEQYSLMIRDGALQAWASGDGGGSQHIQASFGSADVWRHVAMSIEAGANNFILYIDGASAQTGTFGGPPWSHTSGNLQIGRFGPTWGQYFAGAIDDVRIYNRVVSAEELAAIYNSGVGHE